MSGATSRPAGRLRPRAVVFDLDGTLVDSRRDIAAAVNHALVVSGRAALPVEAVVRLVGDGARSLLARATGLPESATALDALLRDYAAYYLAHPADESTWMEGAEDALVAVSARLGLPVALCTNKLRTIADALLAKLAPRVRFDAVYGEGDGPEKKPAPGPILTIARELAVEPAAIVMVGDGPQDVLAARAAGAWSVAVRSGFAPIERLEAARPDALVATITALPALLAGWLAPVSD